MTTEALARQLAEAAVEDGNLWNVRDDPEGLLLDLELAFLPILRPHIERLEKLEAAARRCINEVKDEIHVPEELGFAVLRRPECIDALAKALKGTDHAAS